MMKTNVQHEGGRKTKDLGQRIRELRKNHLDLTQEQFGEKLGVSRDVIKNIELNLLARPEQKEPLLRLICCTFNVNYEWLKEGTGEMRGGEIVANKYDRTTGIEDINVLLHEADTVARIEASAKEMIEVMKKHDLAFFEADEALRTCGIMLRLSVKVI